jgi:hypothetical protein
LKWAVCSKQYFAQFLVKTQDFVAALASKPETIRPFVVTISAMSGLFNTIFYFIQSIESDHKKR